VSDRVPLPPTARTDTGSVSPARSSVEPARHRQFRIQYCLGRGGYGEVYRATMVSPGGLRAEVALKLLRMDLSAHDDAVRRLRDEGRMLGMLHHPAILKVYDLAMLEGRVGLVTEYVDGADLTAVFSALPQRALVEVIAAVAEGLDVAWNHAGAEGEGPLRMVHRDIKPSNIRLGRHGEVKILDFGIARSTAEGADREARTGTGSTVGSLAYMAPERFTRAPPSPASDVHALGCVLYEGLAGRRLFEDPVPVEMFRLAADPLAYEDHVEEAWKQLPADLSPGLSNLLAAMVSHAPKDRPTALDVRRMAEDLAEELPGSSLRAWARDYAWPRSAPLPGFLDGRTITEGSQSDAQPLPVLPEVDDRSSDTFRIEVPGGTPAPPLPREPTGEALAEPARKRTGFAVLAGLVSVAAIVAITVVAGGQLPSRERELPPVAQPAPAPPRPPPARVLPTPAPAPTPAPPPTEVVPAPPPVPGPAPVRPPAPAPAPVPDPVPAPVPAPVPEPSPAPVPTPPAATGQVRVVDPPQRVELRRAGRTFSVSDPLEAAPNYEIWVDFGTGLRNLGFYVQVVPDHVTVVRCNHLKFNCDVD
jgi:serine/threonine protein kinase